MDLFMVSKNTVSFLSNESLTFAMGQMRVVRFDIFNDSILFDFFALADI